MVAGITARGQGALPSATSRRSSGRVPSATTRVSPLKHPSRQPATATDAGGAQDLGSYVRTTRPSGVPRTPPSAPSREERSAGGGQRPAGHRPGGGRRTARAGRTTDPGHRRTGPLMRTGQRNADRRWSCVRCPLTPACRRRGSAGVRAPSLDPVGPLPARGPLHRRHLALEHRRPAPRERRPTSVDTWRPVDHTWRTGRGAQWCCPRPLYRLPAISGVPSADLLEVAPSHRELGSAFLPGRTTDR